VYILCLVNTKSLILLSKNILRAFYDQEDLDRQVAKFLPKKTRKPTVMEQIAEQLT